MELPAAGALPVALAAGRDEALLAQSPDPALRGVPGDAVVPRDGGDSTGLLESLRQVVRRPAVGPLAARGGRCCLARGGTGAFRGAAVVAAARRVARAGTEAAASARGSGASGSAVSGTAGAAVAASAAWISAGTPAGVTARSSRSRSTAGSCWADSPVAVPARTSSSVMRGVLSETSTRRVVLARDVSSGVIVMVYELIDAFVLYVTMPVESGGDSVWTLPDNLPAKFDVYQVLAQDSRTFPRSSTVDEGQTSHRCFR
jgi:hypothetical protein